MIGRLRGVLVEKHTPELLIECAGVGYEVHVPLSTFYDLPESGTELCLLIHHVVREDAQQLFGFLSAFERLLFRNLIKVNGVGAKLALTILSGMSPAQFVATIAAQDVAALVKLPGVGRKTAERLVIEMKDKVKALSADSGADLRDNGADKHVQMHDHISDAESALVALGYKPVDASKAVAAIGDAAAKPVQQLIKEALAALTK